MKKYLLNTNSKGYNSLREYVSKYIMKALLVVIILGVLILPLGFAIDITPPNIVSLVNDGYTFSEDTDLVLGSKLDSIKTLLTESDLPTLLASGVVEADAGDEFDYNISIDLTGTTGIVNSVVTSDLEDEGLTAPEVYFDTSGGLMYTTRIAFNDSWSAEDFLHSEEISLFGERYTFSMENTNNADVLTLYGSDASLLISINETTTVTYYGEEYTLELLEGDYENGTAVLNVNGYNETVVEGDYKIMPPGELPIYIKNMFLQNIGGYNITLELWIGGDKLELNATGGSVTKNDIELDGVTFTRVISEGTSWTNVTDLEFAVDPSALDDEIDYILSGDSFIDPVFDSFEFAFIGADELWDGKEYNVFVKSLNSLVLEFTPRSGMITTVEIAQSNDSSQSFFWTGATLTDLGEDDIFIYNYGSAENNYQTRVLRIDSITRGNDTSNEDFEVVVRDLTFDMTYTMTDTDSPISSKIALYVVNGSDRDHTTLVTAAGDNAPTNYTLYTDAGAEVVLDLTNLDAITATFKEDVDEEYSTLSSGDIITYNITATYDFYYDEYNLDVTPMINVGASDSENYELSKFGTYIIEDADENSYVALYVPSEEVHYDMFIGPAGSTIITTGPTDTDYDGSVTLIVATDEDATCKYNVYDTSYDSMDYTFNNTGTNVHTQALSLIDGTYTYYVRCVDGSNNSMQTSEVIVFYVDTTRSIYAFDMPDNSNGFTTLRYGRLIANYELTGITGWSSMNLSGFLNSSASTVIKRLSTDDVNAVYIYDSAQESWTTYAAPFTSWDFDGHSNDFIGYYVFNLRESAARKSIKHN
ncbi:MAG: hypothetical protein ACP5OA_01480 [Candidatus Woesearchaeota archaeon]